MNLITVRGEGSAFSKPDVAHLSLSVVTENLVASKAMDLNRETTAKTFEVIKQQGVEEKDFYTSGFTVCVKREYNETTRKNDFVGYTVTNSLNITVRNVDDVAKLLDSLLVDDLVHNGLSHLGGLKFGVSDSGRLLDEARDKAFAEASRKAHRLASIAGVNVKEVVSVTEEFEDSDGSRRGDEGQYAMACSFASSQPTSISKGEKKFVARLEVVFGIGSL